MDKQLPANGHVEPGISIRMGPVDKIDVDAPNGMANGKRKSRGSIPTTSYKEQSGSEDDDDKPLVGSQIYILNQSMR